MPTQTGDALYFMPGVLDNAGTVSTTITVPDDATLVVVFCGATLAGGREGQLANGDTTFTKGGIDTAMDKWSNEGCTSGSWMQAAVWSMPLPDTGPNKTLKWDYVGTSPLDDGQKYVVTFWKDVDTASPVRDSTGAQGGSAQLPWTGASVLSCVTGDKIVGFVCGWSAGGEGSIDSWTNLTTLENETSGGGGTIDSALATGDPTTGDVSVGVATATNFAEGGFIALVLKPAAAATDLVLGDYVLDAGLSVLNTGCDKIYICSQLPATFTEATATYDLGSKNWGAGNAFGAPAAKAGGGRQVTSTAITDGAITVDGTVAAWAAVDSANSRLLAAGPLTGNMAVTNGQVFVLSAMTFGISGV